MFGTVCEIDMTDESEECSSYPVVLQQSPVPGQEHQSSGGQEFHHVHGLVGQITNLLLC